MVEGIRRIYPRLHHHRLGTHLPQPRTHRRNRHQHQKRRRYLHNPYPKHRRHLRRHRTRRRCRRRPRPILRDRRRSPSMRQQSTPTPTQRRILRSAPALTGELPSEKTREYLHNRHKDHIFIMGVESEPCVNRLGRTPAMRRNRRHIRRPKRPHNLSRNPRRSRQPPIPRSLETHHRYGREIRRTDDGPPAIHRNLRKSH